MKPRSKEFVDLILEENIEGIDGFVDQLRCCVKDKLKDVDHPAADVGCGW